MPETELAKIRGLQHACLDRKLRCAWWHHLSVHILQLIVVDLRCLNLVHRRNVTPIKTRVQVGDEHHRKARVAHVIPFHFSSHIHLEKSD